MYVCFSNLFMSSNAFSPITDTFVGQVSNAQPVTSQGSTQDNFSWRDVASGIESGSWAVLLCLALIYFLIRKPAKEYVSRQLELMRTLEETQASQAVAIEQINKTQEKTAIALEKIGSNDAAVQETLSDHSVAIVRILSAIQQNQKTISALGGDKEGIIKRQEEQVHLLKQIDSKLQQPIDVHPVGK